MTATVVVPTFRRDQLLSRCLTGLALQDAGPASYEVVVVDDAGSEETRCLVESRAASMGVALRYVKNAGRGPAAARNTGWRLARGEVIAFTDDDCVPDRGWLRAGLAALETGADASWGRMVMPLGRMPTDYERDAARLARAEFVTANCFCLRGALERAGGFDERFTSAWREDSDLLFTLLERNGRLVHASGAVVIHPIRKAPWGISLSQQRKNVFNALLYKKHPALYRERIQSEPPWHYYGAVVSLAAAALAALVHTQIAWVALLAWIAVTVQFCAARLRHTSHAPAHVIEMALTSALIPPLAIFWRVLGAIRYRVFFL